MYQAVIGDKSFTSWNDPSVGKKKNGQLIIRIPGKFSGPISGIIILKKYKYQWILKGCKLVSHETIDNRLWYDTDSDRKEETRLVISYKERSGSHSEEVIKSDIRDWKIRQITS